MRKTVSKWAFVLIMLISVWPLIPSASRAGEDIESIRRSVVKIITVSQVPDFRTPWEPGKSSSGAGSGFIMDHNRILTNAHVVSNARFIVVEKEGDARRYEANVQFIAHDCDLAMLRVQDDAFFENTTPLPLGDVPDLDSIVTVLGYPIGGDRLSVTRGVVSRIDYQVYSHTGVDSHLAIQIDAAINPGNSGGPVIQNGAAVGVAFQGFSGMVAQNVGYMIPIPVVSRFIQDVEDGQYDRYVDIGAQFFPLINPTHRRALGLAPGDFGVMVSEVMQAGAAYGHIEVGDVMLRIDGRPISSDGRVAMGKDRLMLNEVVERKFKGDIVEIALLRGGNEIVVNIPLSTPWPYLTQARQYDVKPRFVIYGGLVFQPLSSSFYATLRKKTDTLRYYYTQFLGKSLYLKHPEVVVISKVLPDPATAYLGRFVYTIVEQINGTRVRTLEDVLAAFQKPSEFYVLRVVGDPQPLVLERAAAAEAHERILRRYKIGKSSHLEDDIVPRQWLTATE